MTKVVKVTAKQLQQIISEEASKYKKVLELKKQKEAIMSELKKISEIETSSKEEESDKPHAVEGGKVKEEKPHSEQQPKTKK